MCCVETFYFNVFFFSKACHLYDVSCLLSVLLGVEFFKFQLLYRVFRWKIFDLLFSIQPVERIFQSTNRLINFPGGIYFIISRSLGPEFGASVGIVFAFANAVAASMNTIGFCDSLNDLLREHGKKIIDNGVQDVRIVGIVAILVMILICAVGMEWESKVNIWRKNTKMEIVYIYFFNIFPI